MRVMNENIFLYFKRDLGVKTVVLFNVNVQVWEVNSFFCSQVSKTSLLFILQGILQLNNSTEL